MYILSSLGHTGRRRAVSGHTLNTLQHINHKKKPYNVLSKFTILCWAALIAILGHMQPTGHGLDTHGHTGQGCFRPGLNEQKSMKFRHATENGMQFKTYELFTSPGFCLEIGKRKEIQQNQGSTGCVG